MAALRSLRRAPALAVGLALALGLTGCSPEAGRERGGGLGADPGNTKLPIQTHGDTSRNNPWFKVPHVGAAPREATDMRPWWAR